MDSLVRSKSRRRPLFSRWLLGLALSLLAMVAARPCLGARPEIHEISLPAQVKTATVPGTLPGAGPGAFPSAFIDAAALREPIRIGALGLVQIGDDPAYAQRDFDDSHWLVVDNKKLLFDYFPGGAQPIIWHRLHLRVNPEESGLGISIEPYGIDRAYEIYVNGQQVYSAGSVSPYVPYTRLARLVVPLPDSQVRTGSLVISIRRATPYATWHRVSSAFTRGTLSLGSASLLRDRLLLKAVRDKAVPAVLALFALAVGLVALALWTSQPQQLEYCWIFALGLIGAASFSFNLAMFIWNLPARWTVIEVGLSDLQCVAFLLLCQALTHRRFTRWLWIYVGAAALLMSVVSWALDQGYLPSTYTDLADAPYYAIFGGIVPVLLFRQFRRGNREAGMLVVFLFFWSLAMYDIVLLSILNLLHIFQGVTDELGAWMAGFVFGPISFSIFDLGTVLFWVSLALIMVLRATRTSRHQAVLESEMAAARAVQHVILPNRVEAIPGFAVESVYLAAQQVCGDFFQIMPVGNGGLLIVIGDVAGKGLPAAMLVSVLIGAIRATSEYTHAPDELLECLNARLTGRFNGGFSTALAAHIDANGMITIANAGHPAPYIDGREIELPGALPLGMVSGLRYETSRVELAPGSRITFYSDGVIEARNHHGELFGFDRSLEISTQPAARIVEAARLFGQCDDITVVAITRTEAIAVAA